MATTPTPVTTLWVCVDCLMAREGTGEEWTGETQYPHPDAAFYVEPYTPPEPLSLLAGQDVTAGILARDHDETCPNYPEWLGAECECDRVTFSTMPCEGCGSHLAGERHALTLWEAPHTHTHGPESYTYTGANGCGYYVAVCGVCGDVAPPETPGY